MLLRLILPFYPLQNCNIVNCLLQTFSEWASSITTAHKSANSGYPTDEMKNDLNHTRKLTNAKQYFEKLEKEFGM